MKAMIEVESKNTVCHLCGTLLVKTFVEKDEFTANTKCYVICSNCVKTLPEIIQKRLEYPPPLKIGPLE